MNFFFKVAKINQIKSHEMADVDHELGAIRFVVVSKMYKLANKKLNN